MQGVVQVGVPLWGFRFRVALISVGVAAVPLAVTAHAADYVNTGTIVASGASVRGLEALGGSNTVVNSGTITTSGNESFSIYASGGSNVVNNTGTITATGTDVRGIYVGSSSNTINNTGTVTVDGSLGRGLYAPGGGNTINNIGTVNVDGDHTFGIYTVGASSNVINSGIVTTRGSVGHGLYIDNGWSSVLNTGFVTTYGAGAYGIYANTWGHNTIVNRGSVVTYGDGSHGVYVWHTLNTVDNFGRISTNGDSAHGIYINIGNNSVTNSGSITASGSNSYAIYFGNGYTNNQLTLLSGTSLSGTLADLYLGSGTNVIVDMDSSASWSYDGRLGSLVGRGTTLVSSTSNTITVVNATGEAVSSSVEAARGMAISGMLDRAAQQAPSGSGVATGEAPESARWTAWAMGYGEKMQRNSSEGSPFSSALWGGAVGLDRNLDDASTVGAFVGGDRTRTWLNQRRHRVAEKNRYLGLRAGADDGDGVFWSAAAYGGIGDVKSRRNVSGGGISSYDTDTVFGGMTGIAGYHQILGAGYGVTYRGRANYDIRHADGYTETIGGVDMSVDDRLSQSVGGRAEVGLDFWGEERRWQVSPRIGVEGWHAVGGDSTGIRFGSSTYHVSDDTTSNVGVVTGLDASYRFESDLRLSAIAEARRDKDGTTTTQGAIQASLPF